MDKGLHTQHDLLMNGHTIRFENGCSITGVYNGAISYYTLRYGPGVDKVPVMKHAMLSNLQLLFEMVANSGAN